MNADLAASRRERPWPAVLGYPFRPFFLVTAAYAVLLIATWLAVLTGALPLALGVSPVLWHGHEMLFGLLPAAITGFLLSAIPNWTGAGALRGLPLLGLVALWLAGRVAMWLSGVLPPWLVVAADMAFVPAVAVYAARVLIAHGNRRNLVLVGVLAVLAIANGLTHFGLWGLWYPGARLGEVLALDVAAVLMLVIGGRITPAFSRNWLQVTGRDAGAVGHSDRLDRWVLVSSISLIPADALWLSPWPGAVAAAAAAVFAGWRLLLWRGWRTAAEPMLWILHLGIAWVVVALAIKAATPALALPPSAWVHAMGTGAIGTLVLGVMTRVALGHTGRPLVLPRGAVSIYVAILAAGVARVLAALGLVDYRAGLWVAAAGWVAGFALYLLYYWPILTRPRADGRPG